MESVTLTLTKEANCIELTPYVRVCIEKDKYA